MIALFINVKEGYNIRFYIYKCKNLLNEINQKSEINQKGGLTCVFIKSEKT